VRMTVEFLKNLA